MDNIKVFLKNVAAFLSILLFCILFPFAVLQYIHKKTFDEFRTGDTVTSIFIGDSHVEMSINDEIVSNSINLSKKSETYYYSYYKLQGLLKDNPSITKIYLGLNYHSLSSYMDDGVFGRYSKDIAPRYFFILPYSEKVKFIKYNAGELSVFLKNSIKSGIPPSFQGRYINNFASSVAKKASMDKRLAAQFNNEDKVYGFSEFNLHYLDKIVNLCREKQVELIFLKTPLHPYYRSRVPETYINGYAELINKYKLPLIDLSNMVLDDSCYIPDGDHVSEKGAVIVSKYLSEHYISKIPF